jgi:hypothetical protein
LRTAEEEGIEAGGIEASSGEGERGWTAGPDAVGEKGGELRPRLVGEVAERMP